jgi:hypothetical protein
MAFTARTCCAPIPLLSFSPQKENWFCALQLHARGSGGGYQVRFRVKKFLGKDSTLSFDPGGHGPWDLTHKPAELPEENRDHRRAVLK